MLAGGVSHRGNSPSGIKPRQGRRNHRGPVSAALPRPCRGGFVFRRWDRWLTPPANFHMSLRDGRKSKSLLIPCHSGLSRMARD